MHCRLRGHTTRLFRKFPLATDAARVPWATLQMRQCRLIRAVPPYAAPSGHAKTSLHHDNEREYLESPPHRERQDRDSQSSSSLSVP